MVVVDAQTFLIPRFSYDGQAPDAHFWVGQGKPGPEGNFVADENGSSEPLRSYKEKTLVIVLPGDLTVFDIGTYYIHLFELNKYVHTFIRKTRARFLLVFIGIVGAMWLNELSFQLKKTTKKALYQ